MMHPIHKYKLKHLHRCFDFFINTEDNKHWYTVQHRGDSRYNVYMNDVRVPFLTIVPNRKGLNIYHDRHSHYKHIPYHDIEFLDLPILEDDKKSIYEDYYHHGENELQAYPSTHFHLDAKHIYHL